MQVRFFLLDLDLDLPFLKRTWTRTWTCPFKVDLDLELDLRIGDLDLDLDLAVAGLVRSLADLQELMICRSALCNAVIHCPRASSSNNRTSGLRLIFELCQCNET